ncbi:hypothetical protein AAMO2058_001288500, partial [Amorphochlora amoebiformis]
MAGDPNQNGSWARVLANGNAVLRMFHEAQAFTEPETEDRAFKLDAGRHAGLLPFDVGGAESISMTERLMRDVEGFDLSESSFADLLDKRRFVFRKLFKRLASEQEHVEDDLTRKAGRAALGRVGGGTGLVGGNGNSFGYEKLSTEPPVQPGANLFEDKIDLDYLTQILANETPEEKDSKNATPEPLWIEIVGPHGTLPPSSWNSGSGPSETDADRIAKALSSVKAKALDVVGIPRPHVIELAKCFLATSETEVKNSEKFLAVSMSLALSLGSPALILKCVTAAERLGECSIANKEAKWQGLEAASLRQGLKNLENESQILNVSVPEPRLIHTRWIEMDPGSKPDKNSQAHALVLKSGQGRPSATKAHSLACTPDGKYLYLHSSAGLERIGTGLPPTVRGHVLAKNPGYCKKEKISIAYLASKLYCLRFQSLWPFVDVFDGETLEALGSIRLGFDLECGWASLCHEAQVLAASGDGRYLHVGVLEPADRNYRQKPGARVSKLAAGTAVEFCYHGRWKPAHVVSIGPRLPQAIIVLDADDRKKKRAGCLAVTIRLPGSTPEQMLEEVALLASLRASPYAGSPQHICPFSATRLVPDGRATNYCDVCRATGTAYRCANGCDWDMCSNCWKKLSRRHKWMQVGLVLEAVEKDLIARKKRSGTLSKTSTLKSSPNTTLQKKTSEEKSEKKSSEKKAQNKTAPAEIEKKNLEETESQSEPSSQPKPQSEPPKDPPKPGESKDSKDVKDAKDTKEAKEIKAGEGIDEAKGEKSAGGKEDEGKHTKAVELKKEEVKTAGSKAHQKDSSSEDKKDFKSREVKSKDKKDTKHNSLPKTTPQLTKGKDETFAVMYKLKLDGEWWLASNELSLEAAAKRVEAG